MKRCDLLYVYSEQEKEKLRKVCDLSKLSVSLEDPSKSKQLHSQEQVDAEVVFVTSGTGVFNKYTRDDARGRIRYCRIRFSRAGDFSAKRKNLAPR